MRLLSGIGFTSVVGRSCRLGCSYALAFLLLVGAVGEASVRHWLLLMVGAVGEAAVRRWLLLLVGAVGEAAVRHWLLLCCW